MPRQTVALVRPIPASVESTLEQRFTLLRLTEASTQQIQAAIHEADALVPSVVDRVTGDLLNTPNRRIRIIANFGAGTDNIDLPAARQHGITVTNTPDALTEDTADTALYLILAAARRTDAAERELRAGAWTGWRPTHAFGTTLRGKQLGIVGYGRIGRALARRALALDMRVRWLNRTAKADEPPTEDNRPAASLDDLLATSDVVSLHLPATSETRHLINTRTLAQMKSGAILINTARGALVDEGALVDALTVGHLAAAGLDVYEHEPRISSELLLLPNVILLPHIGSATPETREAMGMMVVNNLLAFFEGREPPNRVV